MADNAELASRQMELDLERRISSARELTRAHITGKCVNCGMKLDLGRYCDNACRQDFEARERSALIQGRR